MKTAEEEEKKKTTETWTGPRACRAPRRLGLSDVEPVRLVAPREASPFAPGREVAFARVSGSLLRRLGVRDGDHVALLREGRPENGDLAAVADAQGRSALWKVHPEGTGNGEALRLSVGDPAFSARVERPCVRGVVVAVLRKFDDPS